MTNTENNNNEQERYMMHGAPVSIEFIIYMTNTENWPSPPTQKQSPE